jgi:2-polyprenyl-3-methyl-5-hydroxy-6-metoxy-1,4-benzoquinol methylase
MNQKLEYNNYLSAGFENVNVGGKSKKFMAGLFAFNYSKFLPTDKNIKVLDFGCGVGQCLSWLLDSGYKNAMGIEVGDEAVAYCQKNNLPVEKVSNSLEWLKTHPEEFEVIILNDVIEHLPKEQIVSMLSALFGSLKKGGIMIVKTNNVSAITGARMRYWDHTHTTSFTEYSLRQVLLYAGIKDFSFYPFAFPINTFFRLIRKILQLVLHFIWKVIFWIEYTIVPKIVHEYFFAVVKK